MYHSTPGYHSTLGLRVTIKKKAKSLRDDTRGCPHAETRQRALRVSGFGIKIWIAFSLELPLAHFQWNYSTEMCSGSEAGSYLRLIDFVYHSTLGLRVIKKKKTKSLREDPRGCAHAQTRQRGLQFGVHGLNFVVWFFFGLGFRVRGKPGSDFRKWL